MQRLCGALPSEAHDRALPAAHGKAPRTWSMLRAAVTISALEPAPATRGAVGWASAPSAPSSPDPPAAEAVPAGLP